MTVALELDSGRRVPGQRPTGTFQTSVSRATPLAMEALMATWMAVAAADEAVLAIVAGEPRKGGAASLVATRIGVATLEDNEAAKASWTEIVAGFLAAAAPGG